MKKKVLFLCTGNSARSQMAQALVNHDLGANIEAYSAGTNPQEVNPNAIAVMAELGIDISAAASKHVSVYQEDSFDYVITLCDDANESCPVFYGGVKRLHMGFPDPAKAGGSQEEVLGFFRKVRDDIRSQMKRFFTKELTGRDK